MIFNEFCHHDFDTNRTVAKLTLLVIVSPTVGALGIFGNILSISVFCHKDFRNNDNLLLSLLSVRNVGVLLTATMLYTVEVVYDHFRVVRLYIAWNLYLKEVYYLSNAFQTSSVYFTVAATVERWYATKNSRSLKWKTMKTNVVAVFAFSFSANMSRYFEIEVFKSPNCSFGFGSYKLVQSDFARSYFYRTFVSLWFWAVFSFMLPVTVLTALAS